MECRQFGITIISATNLPKTQDSRKMKVYAKVLLAGNAETEWRTPVDTKGDTNPHWNYRIPYTVGEAVVQQGVDLDIKLYSEHKVKDKYLCGVKLSLKEMFNQAQTAERVACVLQRRANELGGNGSYGTVYVGYSFGERFVVEKPSVLMRGLQVIASGFGFPSNICTAVDIIKP